MKTKIIHATIYFSIILILISCNGSNGKSYNDTWIKIPSPPLATIISIAESPNGVLFAGSSSGIYKSIDNGSNWQPAGLPEKIIDEIMVTQNGTLLVGSYRSGIFRSKDSGITWNSVGFVNNVYFNSIVQDKNGLIFASISLVSEGVPEDTPAGVFMSENDGITWKQTSLTDKNISKVFNPKPGLLFATGVGKNNLYCSTDYGLTWTNTTQGLPDSIPAWDMVSSEGSLFVTIFNSRNKTGRGIEGIYRSDDEGKNWYYCSKEIKSKGNVKTLAVKGSTIYAGIFSQTDFPEVSIYKSTNLGTSWEQTNLKSERVLSLLINSDGNIFAGTYTSVYNSKDNGQSWQIKGNGFDNWSVGNVMGNKSFIFAGGNGTGIWRASIPFKTWSRIVDNSDDFTTLPNGKLLIRRDSIIYLSKDNGNNWTKYGIIHNEGFFTSFRGYISNDSLILPFGKKILYSTDQGKSWNEFIISENENEGFSSVFKTSKNTLLAGGYSSIYSSEDNGKNWDIVREGINVWDFVSNKGVLYAGAYAKGAFKSIDDGVTWLPINNGLRKGDEYITISCLIVANDNSIIAGTVKDGIYCLAENDSIWTEYNTGLENFFNWSLYLDNDGAIYASSLKGVFVRNFK